MTVATFALAGHAAAGITYIGGVGLTVYGVTSYGGGAQVVPKYIANNVTGFNDILASPGGVYQLANPVVANNIFQFPAAGPGALPIFSFDIGGGNANGRFGAGAVAINGPQVGFRLSDSAPGGGEASYEISSWTTNFVVGKGGFNGNLGTYLAIGGTLLAGAASSDVAALITHYYVNGVLVGTAPQEVLAASGNGAFVALGGANGNTAGIVFNGNFTAFQGLAVDSIPAMLAAGNTVTVVSTLTAYADPASIDSISITPDLLSETGVSLPSNIIADVSGAVPEPQTWCMVILGIGAMGVVLRRRRTGGLVAA